MKKIFILSITLILSIFANTYTSSAPRRNASSKKRQLSKRSTPLATSSNVNIVNSTLTTTTVTPNTTNETLACGTRPNTANPVAKRICAVAYSTALGIYCEKTECKSAIKTATEMDFATPTLKGIEANINGSNCSGSGLEKFCGDFAVELTTGLWDLYSSKAIRERRTCNFAKAKFISATECLNYVQTMKSENLPSDFFSTTKITEFDKGIEARCGKSAIKEKYNSISITPWDDENDSIFFNSNANSTSGTVGIGSNKKLDSNVATAFANIGTQNWNITGKIGGILDLQLDTRSATYPRDLVVLANTFITEGETSCGSSFKTEMQNTEFEITDKQSNLEREIAKKGLLKGVFDYGLNQASPIMGESKTNEIKNKGIIGMAKSKTPKEPKEPKVETPKLTEIQVSYDFTYKIQEGFDWTSVDYIITAFTPAATGVADVDTAAATNKEDIDSLKNILNPVIN